VSIPTMVESGTNSVNGEAVPHLVGGPIIWLVPTKFLSQVWPLVRARWDLIEGVNAVQVNEMMVLAQLLQEEFQLWVGAGGRFWLITSVRGKTVVVEYMFGDGFAQKMGAVQKVLLEYAAAVGATKLWARITNPRLVKMYERKGWTTVSTEMERLV
jgi:hypothetical protein